MAATPPPFDPIAEAHRQWVEHGWAEVADGMAAVTSVFRVQQLLLARVDEVLRPHELTFARFEVLALLHVSRTGTLPMGLVGQRLQVHPTSVTSAVDRLERQGLVRRTPHPDDGRAKLVHLTASGRRRVEVAVVDLNAQVFADPGLPPDDVDRLVEILGRFRRDADGFAS